VAGSEVGNGPAPETTAEASPAEEAKSGDSTSETVPENESAEVVAAS